MDIQYVGEHLLPGQIGHFFIILGFVASFLAATAFFFSTNSKTPQEQYPWLRLGRISFATHGLSVFIVIGTIFYVMLSEHYEYAYALEHVSGDLQKQYIFSAFWEGQEGSFLLWMFWHVILGFVLMMTAKTWESPVLSVLSVIQLFIGSMILGVYFGADDSFKIGVNPLQLVRDVMDAPIFQRPDYAQFLQGNGLNPLLQNYWMTIHPPTLFLGFASTSVPFCFAIAGLWTGRYKAWLKPVMPWALFSGAILGIGILMGGAWAYEALSFGGYWAWDPVENMSLVPWIVLIAGIHTTLIARNTGHSLRSTFLFFIGTFVLIVYSTFLTRSGILGETSVHAFTEMGLEWQLIGFLGFFTFLGLGMLAKNWKRLGVVSPPKEESAYSKEFWMFVGSLVLIFSAVLISFTTSIPVYNKIFDLLGMESFKRSPPTDVIEHYNKYQLWIAIFVALISSVAQFLRYKKIIAPQYRKGFWMHLAIAAGVATLGTIATTFISNLFAWQYVLLMWAAIFTIAANMDYLITVLRGKVKVLGAPVAHIGFGIMLMGVLFSGVDKEYASEDSFMKVGNAIEGFTEQDVQRNVLLYRGLPTQMSNYMVTYMSDTTMGHERYFTVNYKRYNKEKTKILEEFNLAPYILYSKKGKVESVNPDTKHYFHKDIFTHITSLPLVDVEPDDAQKMEDSLKYETYEIKKGDTIFLSKSFVIFKNFNTQPTSSDYIKQDGDVAIGASLEVQKLQNDTVWKTEPMYLIRKNQQLDIHSNVEKLGLRFRFTKVNPETGQATLKVASDVPRQDFIVLQAIIFPGINLVWLGCLMMMFGLFMSMLKRLYP